MTSIKDVFNHLVLPPQLPGGQDAKIESISDDIVGRLVRATSTLSRLGGQQQLSTWRAVRRCLLRFQALHARGRLEKLSLVTEFQNFTRDQPLLLHIAEQNAALIIRYNTSKRTDSIVFEAFEVSPPSAEVLATVGALVRDFPDCSAQIPLEDFEKQSFQEALADLLEKGSMEPLRCFQAMTTKAHTAIIETRDTASPELVTHVLIPLLESIGSTATEDVPRFRKRVRDDANIQASELPWRRSPVLLALRVGVQRQLQSLLGNGPGRVYYKFLIVTLLVELLNEISGRLAPELTMILRAKICRRLAKLEQEKNMSADDTYGQLFNTVTQFFKDSIEKVTRVVESAWEKFKRDTTRPIPRLPMRADHHARYLSLPNSGRYLQDVLQLPRTRKMGSLSLELPSRHDGAVEQVERFTDEYHQLARLERMIHAKKKPHSTEKDSPKSCCKLLADAISDLFDRVGSAYDSDPEQMSVFILSLFGLWVRLDKHMVALCPLLLEYHPVFTSELLTALHLPNTADMQRLRDVQDYIRARCRRSKHRTTIFAEPEDDSFTVRYVAQCESMQQYHADILKDSEASRITKKTELEEWCDQYDERSLSISGGTCTCKVSHDGSRDIKGCTKCWHWRVRNRMEIYAHEEFLPSDDIRAAAVVFELRVPKAIAAYRNATWKILGLAHPTKPSSASPMKLLQDYEPLQAYGKRETAGITFASRSKSFLGTHYKVAKKKMKASESDVLFPNGLIFSYFDTAINSWIKDFDQPLTFQHVCGIRAPAGLHNTVMPKAIHPPTESDGPTSYEIVASETQCPSSMSVHEFTACQRLLSGKTRRWLSMLAELGASDINFSSESTMQMFNDLASQAGPAGEEPGMLGDIHVIFKDTSFCDCLATQVENRLRNITSNWREVHCMEVMITLILRLCTLAVSKKRGRELLRQARSITLDWIERLRNDVRNAKDNSVAKTIAKFAFWAALLCRRTFSNYTDSDMVIPEDDLSTFVQASLALQESLVVDLNKLPQILKNMLVRDTKMTYRVKSLLFRSIEAFPQSIGAAINACWSGTGSSSGRIFAAWQKVSSVQDRWVATSMRTSATSNPQAVHYNYVEGHLLIDGKPLGRLPRHIRESNEVKQLFGERHLLTYPSCEYGMSYRLASLIEDHEIHFGVRGERIIIRAMHRGQILEYIPSSSFTGSETVDLPYGLISDYIHWLNLTTRCVDFRLKTKLWRPRMKDWKIDLVTRQCSRNKGSSLIDPNSDLCKKVADVFRHFEDPRKITVFQHPNGRLSVEMRHLELSFSVASNGLLQNQALGAEIDPNQDAGTLYGFQSKIVLRDIKNVNRRSIIAPWGNLSSQRHGMHVAIRAAGSTEYAKFEIDDVLGRLLCRPEPRLLYAKAQFHAYTSFVIPDPLTGRTGTEESLHVLQSGYCQAWEPLGESSIEILRSIATLSPKREYYPEHKKTLQTVHWNESLTTTIQSEMYEELVQRILDKSEHLKVFGHNRGDEVDITNFIPSHLRERGIAHRSIYERKSYQTGLETICDRVYKSRGQKTNSLQAPKVHDIVNLFQNQPFRMHTARKLSTILEGWPLIGGFSEIQQSVVASLSDIVDKNLNEQWGSLVNVCRNTNLEEPHSLMFRLSLMSLNPQTDVDAIKILAAFAFLPELKNLVPPAASSFNQFKFHELPSIKSLCRLIALGNLDQPLRMADAKRRKMCEAEGARLAQHFLNQWPAKDLALNDCESEIFDLDLILERIAPEWDRLHCNLSLSEYLAYVEDILRSCNKPKDAFHLQAWNWKQDSHYVCRPGSIVPSLSRDLMIKSLAAPLDLEARVTSLLGSNENAKPLVKNGSGKIQTKETIELRRVLKKFTQMANPLRQQYGRDLDSSLDALEEKGSQNHFWYPILNATVNARRIQDIRTTLASQIVRFQKALACDDSRFLWLELGHLWPCITPITILEQIRSSSSCNFGTFVKEAIVSHGTLITALQRQIRIRDAMIYNKTTRIEEELQNNGHENWSPLEWPDWLLLEIDSDILIRKDQVEVAHAIIAPESRNNMVLQLNMGKGKTSCIVPMAMAVIGDGKQLARLVVPKPLLLPTAQMIQSRLGGLVGREIRHIPFSRRTKLTPGTLSLYKTLHKDMLSHRGVMLSAPEHLLSYKLSGLQQLVSSNLEIAQEMLDFRAYLDSICRDVLDESDVSLAVKTQLIYPSGKQSTVDGHPHRWQVAQSLLALVRDHLPELQRKYPKKVEVIQRGSGYPMICILQEDVEEYLQQRIVQDICTGRTAFLRLPDSSSDIDGENVRRVLLDDELNSKLFKRVAALFPDDNIAKKTLLLIRGLLRDRILIFCLRKRWNVQYGLHPTRDPMAVPFEAKGVPSEQAEFGHPDAAILFTCLAFYYSGLTQTQFGEVLRHILTSHDPSSEYDRWTNTCDTLPEALYHWNVINIDDHGQVEELWKHLGNNRSVLDHYMNHFVFPTHAKQFDVKLQASGWDLPLFSRNLAEDVSFKGAKTTGFSGTNDNKMMLPLTIQQSDLPSLRQTNAEVLTYLLQDRNRKYYLAASGGKRLSEQGLLLQLEDKKIRILIDAGAYILEMGNESLIEAWMGTDTEAQAGIFFGTDNRAWVKYRGMKASVPLLATPFVDRMEECLVYIDEAHTRGVDLKLPQNACGALTLALGQTKDHTVQAAMRLRQLATTQSVCFFAFPETHQSILDVCKVKSNSHIDSSHVVRWLLEQTCRANEQLQRLFVSQGSDFCNRINAEWENTGFRNNDRHRAAYVHALQRPEQQTLEQLYGTHTQNTQHLASRGTMFWQLQAFMDALNQIRQNLSSNSGAPSASALEEVEQEREVEFQVEEVRQVQKITHHKARRFMGLHPAILAFVNTGILSGGLGYEHVFDAIARTSIGEKFEIIGTGSQLFVSEEFMKTIKEKKSDLIDNFMRPVEWILYSPTTGDALIIIAEEVEIIIPKIRDQKSRVKIHLLTYSAPVTKKMIHFSGLKYYSFPALPVDHILSRQLTIEVGLFAGRLYMDYEECNAFVKYIEATAFSKRLKAPLNEKLSFIFEWISLRRKGQDIMHTPVGYVCQGRPLNSEHAFFITQGFANKAPMEAYRSSESTEGAHEEDDDEDDREEEWYDVDEGQQGEEPVPGERGVQDEEGVQYEEGGNVVEET